jgi:hypothetical protein
MSNTKCIPPGEASTETFDIYASRIRECPKKYYSASPNGAS